MSKECTNCGHFETAHMQANLGTSPKRICGVGGCECLL